MAVFFRQFDGKDMGSSCLSKMECRRDGWVPEIAAPNPCYERLKYGQNILKKASELTTFLSAGLVGIQYFTSNDFFAASVLLVVLGVSLTIQGWTRLVKIRYVSFEGHVEATLKANLTLTPAPEDREEE